jgi:hypothetical protein
MLALSFTSPAHRAKVVIRLLSLMVEALLIHLKFSKAE